MIAYRVTAIQFIRDRGTTQIETNIGRNIYVHKEDNTLHSAYPPLPENIIADQSEVNYLKTAIAKHLDWLLDDFFHKRERVLRIKFDTKQ